MTNGTENDYRNRIGRLYHWRLYLFAGTKPQEEVI